MNDTSAKAPECPGCHYRCLLDAYQCARGKGFYGKWLAGEGIPKRRAPRKGDSSGPKGAGKRWGIAGHGPGGIAPSADMKLMRMLGIVGIALSEHREEDAERLVLDSITRHNGCTTERIVAGRVRMDGEALAPVLDKLREAELIVDVDDEVAGPMLQATEEGIVQAEAWRKERASTDAAFVDALTEEEKEQLAGLLAKMLTSSAHAGKMF